MSYVSAQGIDECIINIHYYYYYDWFCSKVGSNVNSVVCLFSGVHFIFYSLFAISIRLSGYGYSSCKCITTHACHAGNIRQWSGCQSLEFFACAQMLMHMVQHGSCRNTVQVPDSALKADSDKHCSLHQEGSKPGSVQSTHWAVLPYFTGCIMDPWQTPQKAVPDSAFLGC